MENNKRTDPIKKCIAVIPSVEGWDLLARLIPSIDLPKDQIFVVDQGSHDGTEKNCHALGVRCIQMGAPATFTRAVNRGIEEALAHNADYVLLINNDVEFETHVATQLIKRVESEAKLGVLAPRQILVRNGQRQLEINRVYWQLSTIDFNHDLGSPGYAELIESDFCEFTCVLITSEVLKTVGLLDERYEFYHEDADFCFRCQLAGYRCAYDQTAFITHFASSTFDKQKIYKKEELIKRNKNFFASDYLKHHVNYPMIISDIRSSWSITNEFMYSYFSKYGLINPYSRNNSLSTIAHPEMVKADYLLTVWETSKLPMAWVEESKKFKHIFVPSNWNKTVFENSGFNNVSTIPFGIETDIFNPWGPKLSFSWSKSVLYVCLNQHRKALDVTLRMWDGIREKHPGVFLVLYVKDIDPKALGIEISYSMQMGNFHVRVDSKNQIALLKPAFKDYVDHSDMAMLYRSVEIYLLNSRSEGFGYSVGEAMACGITCVIPNYGAAKEFVLEGNCITFEGVPTIANYCDKGFEDVGLWWEPDLTDLSMKMEEALRLNGSARATIGHTARQSILTRYTWRHCALALRKELEHLQKPSTYKFKSDAESPSLTEKKMVVKYRIKTSSLLTSFGNNILKAAAIMQVSGFREVSRRVAKKIIKKCVDMVCGN